MDRHRDLATYTWDTVKQDIQRWKESEPLPPPGGRWLLFLGTGGNPVNLISQQSQTGGFLLKTDSLFMHVDPGPGALVHACRLGIDLGALDAVYVSHAHTDHSGDAGPVIEAMCRLMSKRKGAVIAPSSVFQEGIISRYHQGKLPSWGYSGGPERLIASGGEPEKIGSAEIRFIRAYHGDDNYGFVVQDGDFSIGYTSDTSYVLAYMSSRGAVEVTPWDSMEDFRGVLRFREELKHAFSGIDVLVANVSYFGMFANRCLTAVGLAHMLQGSGIGRCIITHLDACCLRPRDIRAEMAAYVEGVSGVPTSCAEDNLLLDLGAMD
ncbi:MAG: MBL fold metallo-hydrolase [Bacillota bacterium]